MLTVFWLENLKVKTDLKDVGVDGKITLEWILGNRVERCGLDASVSGQGPVAGSCEHGNGNPCFIKRREFLD